MKTVRDWAQAEGFDYEYIDDDLFELAPEWARQQCSANVYALTDICRLQWLRDKLDSGYERAVWADADVLVFAPDRISISTRHGYGFAHELFLRVLPNGGTSPDYGMNNALMVFHQDQEVLVTYLEECFLTLRNLPEGPGPAAGRSPDPPAG